MSICAAWKPRCSNLAAVSTPEFSVALRAGIPPFYVMDVWLAAAERQRSHGDLVNLSAGQPGAKAPAPIRAAAADALANDNLGYTVALGIHELREAIAASYADRYGITVEPDDVVVTTGSTGGFLLAFLACFDVGDRVAVTSPGYPCYRNILSALGCEVVEVPCGPDTRFQPTVEMLAAINPPIKGVVIASPANPTGTVHAARRAGGHRDVVHEIGRAIGQRRDLPRPGVSRCAADELRVGDLTRRDRGEQLLEVLRDDRLAARLAAGAAAAAARGRLADRKLLDLPADAAAEGGRRRVHAGVDRRGRRAGRAVRRQPRAAAAAGCPQIGLGRLAPADGAFYVYADIADYSTDSLEFCAKLLADTGVAIAPGVDFDTVHGGSLRAAVVRRPDIRRRRGTAPDGSVAGRFALSAGPPLYRRHECVRHAAVCEFASARRES